MIIDVPLLVDLSFYIQSNVNIMIMMKLDKIIKVVLHSYSRSSVGNTGKRRRENFTEATENGGVMV